MKNILCFFILLIISFSIRAGIDNIQAQDVVRNYVENSGFESGFYPHSFLPRNSAVLSSQARSGFKSAYYTATLGTDTNIVIASLPIGQTYDTYFFYKTASTGLNVTIKDSLAAPIFTFSLPVCASFCKTPVKPLTGGQSYSYSITGAGSLHLDDFRVEVSASVGAITATSPIVATSISGGVEISLGTIDYLNFNTAISPIASNGRLHFDQNDKTLTLDVDAANNVSLQIGQEQYIRAVAGENILDGQVVYICGAQGNRPKVCLAKAITSIADKTIAVATQNCNSSNECMFTTSGVVGGYNTSTFADGDRLYLSNTSSGTLVNTMPLTPNLIVPVAWALNTTNNGKILIDVRSSLDTSLASDTDNHAPTVKAVKTYVDSLVVSPTHNTLSGLQGGILGEYYHTTANQNLVLSTLSASGTEVKTTSNLEIESDKFFYFGDSNTDESIRVYQSGGALITEKRKSGVWTEIFRVDEN